MTEEREGVRDTRVARVAESDVAESAESRPAEEGLTPLIRCICNHPGRCGPISSVDPVVAAEWARMSGDHQAEGQRVSACCEQPSQVRGV